jgi:hypothetical protein
LQSDKREADPMCDYQMVSLCGRLRGYRILEQMTVMVAF